MLQNVNICENKGPKSSSKPIKILQSGLVWFVFQHNGQTFGESGATDVLENIFDIYLNIVYILRRNIHKVTAPLGKNQLKTYSLSWS